MFEREGYVVIDLSQRAKDSVCRAISMLETDVGPLSKWNPSDHEKDQRHHILSYFVSWMPREVVELEASKIMPLIGRDLMVQRLPYLRIARPLVEADNIGLHRDTWYGAQDHEFSISIALTDQDEGNALRIAPGSHLKPYETENIPGVVERGSVKHRFLGFPYAPKREINPPDTIAVPLKVGQALVFSIAALHGQVVNESENTRFTMDARIADAAKVGDNRQTSVGDYYMRLAA